MKHAAPTRRELGIRTAFNLLGPLTNPAGATRQIVGVPRPELTELLARALLLLGSTRAWVVHGADGIDEISTTGLHEGVRVPRRRGAHVLRPSGGLRLREGGAGRPAGRRRGRRTRRSSARVLDGAAGRAARRRAAECRRGAVRRRPRADRCATGFARAARRSTRARRGRRSTRWCARSQRGGWSHDAAPDLLRDDRRGDAADHRGRGASASRWPRWSGARRRAAPRGDRVRGGARRRPGRVNVIAECKRRSPSRGVLAADYDPVAIARQYERGRRGGDLGADRADVLRRRARASRGGARGGRRCRSCARTSSSTSTSCSRRARPAPTRCC